MLDDQIKQSDQDKDKKLNQNALYKFISSVLEINDLSFKYYFLVYLIFFIATNPGKDFLIRDYPLNPQYVFWFVVISGILKLFYRKEEVADFLTKRINYLDQKNIESRFLRSLINLLPKNKEKLLELLTKSTKPLFHILLITFFASSLILNLSEKFFSDFYEKLPKVNFTVFFIITIIIGLASDAFNMKAAGLSESDSDVSESDSDKPFKVEIPM